MEAPIVSKMTRFVIRMEVRGKTVGFIKNIHQYERLVNGYKACGM